jgi:rhomboid protease GluP
MMRNTEDHTARQDSPVVVWSGGSDAECAELSLVLVASGIEHERSLGPRHEPVLRVRAADATRAASELAEYRSERRQSVHPPPPPLEFAGAWLGVAAYAVVLLLVAICAREYALGLRWLASGELQAGRVLDGELWRAVTALTLHANGAHLAGNLAFGGFFGYFVGRYFGAGLGWFAIVAGGVFGNVLNSVIQPADHRAIGASTAVFAALGLLTAHAWRRGAGQTSWRARFAPVAAGIGLLAFTGTAGEHTDILAHLMGFAAGFGIGALLARMRLPRSRSSQAAFGAAAAGLVLLAWTWGLAAAG